MFFKIYTNIQKIEYLYNATFLMNTKKEIIKVVNKRPRSDTNNY